MTKENEKRLRQCQTIFKRFLEDLTTFVENKLNSATIQQIQLRLNDLITKHATFLKNQDALEFIDEDEMESKIRSEIDDFYYHLRPALEVKLIELQAVKTSKHVAEPIDDLSFTPKLPELVLDHYYGDPTKWRSFIEAYNTHVHNNPRLNGFIKFQYLKNCVKSPADKPFENLEFVGANYEAAYNLLIERNEKPKLIGEAHIRALFQLKPLDKPSPQRLLELLDDFNSHLRSLKTMGRPTDFWDDLVVYLMASKFDEQTKLKWRDASPLESLPSFADISKFIKQRSSKLEEQQLDLPSYQTMKSSQVPKVKSHNQKSNRHSFHTSTSRYFCVNCKLAGHSILRCIKFQAMSSDERRALVKQLSLCFNCLNPAHHVDQCLNRDVCRLCKIKHHTLLHPSNQALSSTSQPIPSTSRSANIATSLDINSRTSLAAVTPSASFNSVLLATALVKVYDSHNKPIIVRALLDSGSQLNFVTRSLASKLGLQLSKSKFNIRGIGCAPASTEGFALIKFESLVHEYYAEIDVQVISKISNCQPATQLNISNWSIPSNIRLADPNFFISNKIDILIGAELFYELQSIGQINLGSDLPTLQNTRLGWVVSGRIVGAESDQICNFVEQDDPNYHTLDELLERFWALEEVPAEDISIATSNVCEDHFKDTYTRSEDGRFVVQLPFCNPDVTLGDSSTMARRRFMTLERRLNRYPELRESYNNFMSEYLRLHHMEPVSLIEQNHYYLPHHCVLKPDSSTTKLRVVFDGSAKASCGSSLNQHLMPGNVVQNELFAILLRFRAHAYAISADISKMYRQIFVHSDHRRFQYIFWRFNESDSLKTYRLNTVTYGTTSAPFLATRCLLQLAHDYEQQFPEASSVVRDDFYVDDLLTGSNSRNKIIELRTQISNILHSAGMHLHKWCANDPHLIDDIPQQDREELLQIDDNEFVKTLGIYWQSSQDMFRINVTVSTTSSSITKRQAVSDIAKIFDPIGLISPVVIVGKMFLQELWKIKVDWDESLPMNLHTQWLNFRTEIQALKNLYIPRHIFDHIEDPRHIQIHGFADASEKAYGAAIYVRCLTPSSNYIVRLYCSKSRVVPLKKTTLPRLELCASQLLAQLVAKILPTLNFSVDKVFYWSDSTIVLHWLQSISSRWQTYVANRVASIQSLSEVRNWRHVESRANSADVISRGLRADQLMVCDFWWNGPKFLLQPDETWNHPFVQSTRTDLPEMRKASVLTSTIDDTDPLQRIHSKNSFLRLQNTMSYVLRFIHNCRNRNFKLVGPLSSLEAKNGHRALIQFIQRSSFSDVYSGLQSSNYVVRDPRLKSLSLFMGNDNLIRVGGRLKYSSLSYSSKHPILLPHNHFATTTIISFIHQKHLHVGPQGLLAAVRQMYWPISGRRLSGRVYSNCVICRRARPMLLHQKMGDLPSERVNKAMPFEIVGVDYCGPFYVHYSSRGRVPTKAYLAIFVCFATKAVHLELAANLTTASFMGTLKRFIATRGICKKIVSDNGTNFVGANSELHQLYEILHNSDTNNELQLLCQRDKIEWSFAPPGSPHFGGLYEAAVKSAKFHLRRIITNVHLTYEELSTIIKQVEAVLNSRPLIPVPSSDPIEVLTPGHFLTGRPLTALPETNHVDENPNLLRHWQLVQNIHQHFWKRWSQEYLQELQKRHFWINKCHNIPIDTVVLLKDENLPPLQWQFGRVIEVHPGKDGVVRVVTIKVAGSGKLIKRAITKIAPLPTSVEQVQGGEDDNASNSSCT